MALSARFPQVLPLAIAAHCAVRRVQWVITTRHAARRAVPDGACTVTRHSSVLMRRLGSVDMRLQRNKVTNLDLALRAIDGLVLRPGDEFSFWRHVGRPSARRGFQPGLILFGGGAFGEGTGGGICQLANLLYWMALHTPLEIVERHHHGYDIFPDSGRVLPFGTGAGVMYNYRDLRFRNPTSETYVLRLWLTDTDLCGAIDASAMPEAAYHIRQRDHRFVRRAGRLYRENTLERHHVNRRTGRTDRIERLSENCFPVLYQPAPSIVIEEE